MPEVKNTFIQSKMNKDMDGRIIPNGQYRDGRNIQISKSEGDDVGALETVLGNSILSNLNIPSNLGIKAIGSLFDDNSDSIFVFLTNYNDNSSTDIGNTPAGNVDIKNYVVQYNTLNNTVKLLVEGLFLNFSINSPIHGVNLLEGLLFWTDNRNQPRKINIKQPEGYYVNEDQISVAKYYPYEAPLLLSPVEGVDNNIWESTMTDTVSEYLPAHCAAKIKSINSANIEVFGLYSNIKKSENLTIADGNLITGANINKPVFVSDFSLDLINRTTTITMSSNVDGLSVGDIVYFKFLNPDFNNNWPGDPDFLKEKFIRFSYRFKFDDGEYSLAAPFTQIAFIPQQDGYFIGYDAVNPGEVDADNQPTLVGQESQAFDSTIVRWFENKVTNVKLNILAPTEKTTGERMLWKDVNEKLKVTSIDILYKESMSNKQTIVDTLSLDTWTNNNSEYLFYNYQSRKPWKTLPPDQTTRVSEAVPVRALAQEVSGNRVMYGNYVDKNTSPVSLNYTLNIASKPFIPEKQPGDEQAPEYFDQNYYVRKEYQNHTLKQNRTYQAGIILSDRYGRQSNIILSDVKQQNTDPTAKGSTIFHDYKSVEDNIITDKEVAGVFGSNTWPGDQMFVTFDGIVPEERNPQTGYPGVYSINDNSAYSLNFNKIASTTLTPCEGLKFRIFGYPRVLPIDPITGQPEPRPYADVECDVDSNNTLVNIKIVETSYNWDNGMPFRTVNPGSWIFPTSVECSGNFNKIIAGSVNCPPNNPLGWYSWKVVIKQTEQEYYNVYLPGAMAGYPCVQNKDLKTPNSGYNVTIPNFEYPVGTEKNTSHVVLYSDNINKVPRDLQEVGPIQTEFSSSERLYFRVESVIIGGGIDPQYSSKAFQANEKGDKVVTIADMELLGLGSLKQKDVPIIPNLFYKGDQNPLIARVQTNKQFGLATNKGFNLCEEAASVQIGKDENNEPEFVPVFNSKFGTGPTLAVAETKPVESLLDIFWETSSSGLISELNKNILFNDNTIPTGVTDPNITWNESDNYGSVISGNFQAAGAAGNPLGPSCEIALVKVEDFTGAQKHPLAFVLNDAGQGEYNISLGPYYNNIGTGLTFICRANDNENLYRFYFEITDLGSGDTVEVSSVGEIFNSAPEQFDQWHSKLSAAGIKERVCDWSKLIQGGMNGTGDNGWKTNMAYYYSNQTIMKNSLYFTSSMQLKAFYGSQRVTVNQKNETLSGDKKRWFNQMSPYNDDIVEDDYANEGAGVITDVNYGPIMPPTLCWYKSGSTLSIDTRRSDLFQNNACRIYDNQCGSQEKSLKNPAGFGRKMGVESDKSGYRTKTWMEGAITPLLPNVGNNRTEAAFNGLGNSNSETHPNMPLVSGRAAFTPANSCVDPNRGVAHTMTGGGAVYNVASRPWFGKFQQAIPLKPNGLEYGGDMPATMQNGINIFDPPSLTDPANHSARVPFMWREISSNNANGANWARYQGVDRNNTANKRGPCQWEDNNGWEPFDSVEDADDEKGHAALWGGSVNYDDYSGNHTSTWFTKNNSPYYNNSFTYYWSRAILDVTGTSQQAADAKIAIYTPGNDRAKYTGFMEYPMTYDFANAPSSTIEALTGGTSSDSYTPPWDGRLIVKNGSWGSRPGESWPTSFKLGQEMSFEIIRAYQVSMWIPSAQLEHYQVYGEYDGAFGGPRTGASGAAEIVFGLYESFPEVWTGGAVGSGEVFYSSSANYCAFLPKGPVYYDFQEPGSKYQDMLSFENGGESVVGQRQNRRTDTNITVEGASTTYPNTTNEYPHHYWPDLNALLTMDSAFENFRNDPEGAMARLAEARSNGKSYGEAGWSYDVPPFMALQPGTNTFYQHNYKYASTQYYHTQWGADEVNNYFMTPKYNYGNSGGSTDKGGPAAGAGSGFTMLRPNQIPFDATTSGSTGGFADVVRNALNDYGHLFYINPQIVSKVDINGNTVKVGSPQDDRKFFVTNESPTSNQDLSKFAYTWAHAGNPNKAGEAWGGSRVKNQDGWTPSSAGNGLPGGRYVVTVRATDKNGDADGMYTEFDLPVTLPAWDISIRPWSGCRLSGTCCNDDIN